MGKHTAADDSTVHPLVAEALSRRAGAPAGTHGEHSAGSTGWPETERERGEPVGWPDDTASAPYEDTQKIARGSVDRALAPVVPATPCASPRGWRRLFGARPAA